MSAPSPLLGHSQTGVCLLFPSPRGGIHFGVRGQSGLLAHGQACGAGIWRISWGGSARCTGAGGAGLACFSFGDPLREGPWGTGRELDPLEGWIHRSTALGVCAVQASSVKGTDGSLWDFGWGMGEGDGAGKCLCSLPS